MGEARPRSRRGRVLGFIFTSTQQILLSRLHTRSQAPESGCPPLPGESRAPPLRAKASRSLFVVLRDALQGGSLVEDRLFDRVYPTNIRRLSPLHWTPVKAAMRAAKLLAHRPGARLLDIGSGVGKFCIVAAATVRARVAGVEQRGHLVEISERAAVRFDIDVTFTRGTIASCDPAQVDGIYLFNPFAENLCPPEDQIDETVELSMLRFAREIEATRKFLRAASIGTHVVTYCGFGGEMPAGYERVLQERCGGMLELWVKTSERPRVRSETT